MDTDLNFTFSGSGATGRNGGHLTPVTYQDFVKLTLEMGIEEAKKQFALEHHTVDALVQIIKENGLEEAVDLVSGGHFDMLFTEREIVEAHSDIALAKESGMDTSTVKFHSKEEMAEVKGSLLHFLTKAKTH